MYEPGWLTFYTAARDIEHRFGGSQAEAQAKLRRACAKEKIRSMKAPYEEPGQLPFEFWTRIAPREWREREVDYDGPDADGCKIEVMINEGDFRHWIKQQEPKKPEPVRRASNKLELAKQAIDEIWKGEIPESVLPSDIVKKVADRIAEKRKRQSLSNMEISRETILRAAGRKGK